MELIFSRYCSIVCVLVNDESDGLGEVRNSHSFSKVEEICYFLKLGIEGKLIKIGYYRSGSRICEIE